MSDKTKTIGVVAAALVVGAAVLVGARGGPAILKASPSGATVTQGIELYTAAGDLVPCGGSVADFGDLAVSGYAVSSRSGTFEFRVGYGINGGTEAWYGNVRLSMNAGTAQQLVMPQVQDVDPGVFKVTFVLNSVGYTKKSCTVNTSGILNPSEGIISQRPLIAGDMVDEVRIVASEYNGGAPITCGDVTTDHLSRVRYTVQFLSDTDVWASLHTHVENPGKTGPDQNGDGLNNRWWELTTAQLIFVPANTWKDAGTFVTASNPGVNVIHGSEASADGRKVETFCTYRV